MSKFVEWVSNQSLENRFPYDVAMEKIGRTFFSHLDYLEMVDRNDNGGYDSDIDMPFVPENYLLYSLPGGMIVESTIEQLHEMWAHILSSESVPKGLQTEMTRIVKQMVRRRDSNGSLSDDVDPYLFNYAQLWLSIAQNMKSTDDKITVIAKDYDTIYSELNHSGIEEAFERNKKLLCTSKHIWEYDKCSDVRIPLNDGTIAMLASSEWSRMIKFAENGKQRMEWEGNMMDIALRSDDSQLLVRLLGVMSPRVIKVSAFTRNEQVKQKITSIIKILQRRAEA